MTRILGKLLCWIGWHKTVYYEEPDPELSDTERYVCECSRCAARWWLLVSPSIWPSEAYYWIEIEAPRWTDEMAARRAVLVQKKYDTQLTPAEQIELDELQAMFGKHQDEVAPLP